ncbi:alpha/beta hydrolase [Pseudonocardia yuanmonensis]|uniref:Alpha/beta hydrolase n=1 Tax=Pseudonocardia yuanmonensis TaxID=1095914 RepID=A0ABP8W0Z7_9PSEU
MDPTATEDAPRWFRTALDEPPVHGDTEVEGARVHYRAWGEEGRPGLVLVHGGAAHSGWWDHIAPFFSAGNRVVALDLTGHGDSEHRRAYDLDLWAREVMAVADAGGVDGPPTVIGHSMGGWVTATVGARFGAEVDGIVIIDSPLNEQPPEEERLRRKSRTAKVYDDRETILGRFTTMPAQEVLLPYVRRHIAEESVKAVDAGWSWKFDPSLFAERVLLRDLLPELKCRAGFLRSEFGLVPDTMAGEIDALLGHRVPIVDLPATGHHPMLDQPLVLVTALRALLRQWAVDSLPD